MRLSFWRCVTLSSLLGSSEAIATTRPDVVKDHELVLPRQNFPAGPTLQYTNTAPGTAVKPGTKLRILCVGDSITVGHSSSHGNGYRSKLLEDLSSKSSPFALEVPTDMTCCRRRPGCFCGNGDGWDHG